MTECVFPPQEMCSLRLFFDPAKIISVSHGWFRMLDKNEQLNPHHMHVYRTVSLIQRWQASLSLYPYWAVVF